MKRVISVSKLCSVENLSGYIAERLPRFYLDVDAVLFVENLNNPAVLYAASGSVYIRHNLTQLRFC